MGCDKLQNNFLPYLTIANLIGLIGLYLSVTQRSKERHLRELHAATQLENRLTIIESRLNLISQELNSAYNSLRNQINDIKNYPHKDDS